MCFNVASWTASFSSSSIYLVHNEVGLRFNTDSTPRSLRSNPFTLVYQNVSVKIQKPLYSAQTPTGQGRYWALDTPWRQWPTRPRCRTDPCRAGAGHRRRTRSGRHVSLRRRGSGGARSTVRAASGRREGRWRRRARCSQGRSGDTWKNDITGPGVLINSSNQPTNHRGLKVRGLGLD